MDDLTLLITFFGWCSVINIGLLLFSTLFINLFNNFTKTIHSRMFNIPETELDIMYFKYIANYKTGIILFNIAPYFALKIMLSA